MPPCVFPAPLCAVVSCRGCATRGQHRPRPSSPVTSSTSCSPALAPGKPSQGQAGAGAGGLIFPWRLPKIFVPLCPGGSFLGEPGALRPGVRQCVCPGTASGDPRRVAAWGVCAPAPLGATRCQSQPPPYGDVPMAMPVPGWHRRSVSASGSHVGSQPCPHRGDTVKRCCPRSAPNPAQPCCQPRCLPRDACAL